MRVGTLRNSPFILIAAMLLLVLLIGRIPIKEHLHTSEFVAEHLDGLITAVVLICIIAYIIKKLAVPHSYFASISARAYIYYLPAILLVLIPAHELSRVSDIDPGKLLLFGFERLARGFFEEVLFRGAVFGILLKAFHGSRNGIPKSIVISSVLFGLMHIINIWTIPGYDPSLVVTQVYAAACIGILFSATYAKTRSLIVLGFLHFMKNFFGELSDLGAAGGIVQSVEHHSTIAETVASNILGLLYYGWPLIAGLYIMKKIGKEDVDALLGRTVP